jgi:hypothetical protein
VASERSRLRPDHACVMHNRAVRGRPRSLIAGYVERARKVRASWEPICPSSIYAFSSKFLCRRHCNLEYSSIEQAKRPHYVPATIAIVVQAALRRRSGPMGRPSSKSMSKNSPGGPAVARKRKSAQVQLPRADSTRCMVPVDPAVTRPELPIWRRRWLS